MANSETEQSRRYRLFLSLWEEHAPDLLQWDDGKDTFDDWLSRVLPNLFEMLRYQGDHK